MFFLLSRHPLCISYNYRIETTYLHVYISGLRIWFDSFNFIWKQIRYSLLFVKFFQFWGLKSRGLVYLFRSTFELAFAFHDMISFIYYLLLFDVPCTPIFLNLFFLNFVREFESMLNTWVFMCPVRTRGRQSQMWPRWWDRSLYRI